MPLPLILGASLLQGGVGALTGFSQADAERKRIKEKNAQIDAAKARIEAERENLQSWENGIPVNQNRSNSVPGLSGNLRKSRFVHRPELPHRFRQPNSVGCLFQL